MNTEGQRSEGRGQTALRGCEHGFGRYGYCGVCEVLAAEKAQVREGGLLGTRGDAWANHRRVSKLAKYDHERLVRGSRVLGI